MKHTTMLILLSQFLALHIIGVAASRTTRLEVKPHQLQMQNGTAHRELEHLLSGDVPGLPESIVQDVLTNVLRNWSSTYFYLRSRNPYVAGMLILANEGLSGLCQPDDEKGTHLSDTDAKHQCKEPIEHPIAGQDQQFLRYNSVADILKKVPEKQHQGIATRGNELGLLRLSPKLWMNEVEVSTRKIGLGDPAEKHQKLRPVFDILFADDKWKETDLEASASNFMKKNWMSGKIETEFMASDIFKWTTNELHKIHLGFELKTTGFEVKDFKEFQTAALGLSVLDGASLESGLFLHATSYVTVESIMRLNMGDVATKRDEWIQHYIEHLSGTPKKFIEDYMEHRKKANTPVSMEFIIKGLGESLLFAGGLSLPGLIQKGLAVLHSKNSPMNSTTRNALLKDGTGLEQFILEVVRLYPAVVGFPYYEKVEGSKEPKHMIGNVAMAMRDPAVFENPLTFNPKRNVTLLRQKIGMAWAEPANGEKSWSYVQENPTEWASKKHVTPDSHGCPGELLSYVMMKAFFKQWVLVHENVEVIQDGEFKDAPPFTPDLKFRTVK